MRKATFRFLLKFLRNNCGFSEKNEENFFAKEFSPIFLCSPVFVIRGAGSFR